MRPTFLTRLVNGELFDPIVYIRILNQRQALMLDCGRFFDLSNHELMLVEHLFISHAHMDHFMGFDQVLRVILHRENPLNVYGPPGIRRHVLAKLEAYTWNLTREYALEVRIHEVAPDLITSTVARAGDGFAPLASVTRARSGTELAQTLWYTVEAIELDHNTPCLGFVVKEAFHINIRGEMLTRLGYVSGPWLGMLKTAIHTGKPMDVEVRTRHGIRLIPSEELAQELVIISPGQKITYLTDIRHSPANLERILPLARNTDILFIEAFYLDERRDQAYQKGHLTARQAGEIARDLDAKRVVPMHISPRYHDRREVVVAELNQLISALK
ncbi:MAG: MBL fold metallo-hydrolase [Syntrophaceae bacterium]